MLLITLEVQLCFNSTSAYTALEIEKWTEYIQGVSEVTPDFIQLKSQWIFFNDIFYIYAFSNNF